MIEYFGMNLASLIETASTAVVGVVAVAAAWAAKRYVDDGTERVTAREVLWDAGRAAVAETYETYVKALKERAADGRLTTDEKSEARRIAVERAKQIAKSRGVDLAKTYGEEIVHGIVEQIVNVAKMPRARTA